MPAGFIAGELPDRVVAVLGGLDPEAVRDSYLFGGSAMVQSEFGLTEAETDQVVRALNLTYDQIAEAEGVTDTAVARAHAACLQDAKNPKVRLSAVKLEHERKGRLEVEKESEAMKALHAIRDIMQLMHVPTYPPALSPAGSQPSYPAAPDLRFLTLPEKT